MKAVRGQDSVPRGGGIYGSNIDVVKKEGVYKARTLGFASGRIWAGLGWSQHVSGETQCLRGRECSSSPTSGTCFPCSGACAPLNVYKSPLMGPCGGPGLVWRLL
jgi:hypothetical protein